jgi:hypothetical protein
MKRLPLLQGQLALALLLTGCAPKSVPFPPPPAAPVVNSVWNNAIAAARRDPAYAGSYVANKVLWIGFTRDEEAKLSSITNQPDIRAFKAQHSAIELDRAFKSTVELLSISKFGATSVNIDYRLSTVTVATAYSLQDSGGPTPKCSTLPAIPATAPETNVKLVDIRDCKK